MVHKGKVRNIIIAVLLITVRAQNGEEDDSTTISDAESIEDDQINVAQSIFESVIDEEMCNQQLDFLRFSRIAFRFLDASARLPHGVLTGNLNDLGNYHQCLAINEESENMVFEGKYCTILVPVEQDPINIPTLPPLPTLPSLPTTVNPGTESTDDVDTVTTVENTATTDIPGTTETEASTLESEPNVPEETSEEFNRRTYYELKNKMQIMMGIDIQQPPSLSTKRNDSALRVPPLVVMASAGSTLAFCIPKVCPTRQAVDYIQRYFPFVQFQYAEYYCRLPNDKPFVAADYVACAVFGTLILLVIASTTYDIHHIFVLKRDPSKANVLYRSFSIYTNLIRMLTFNKNPGALECMDGIRAISMLWVIIGHTYVSTNLAYVQNLNDVVLWVESFWSLWITSAPMTVDTFFLMSGILVVYSIISKITFNRFVRTLHLYVANRVLRMFPILAAVVLLQASLFNHLSDGPYWESVAISVERCRQYWWSALLYVQNYVNPYDLCLGHSWYISVDTQLYILAPIVMIFLFGSRKVAFSALGITMLISIVVCATYSFVFNFPSAIISFGRFGEFNEYMTKYYINTITRSPPFVIGMIYGYLLHINRNKRIHMHTPIVVVCWILSFVMMAMAFFGTYPVIQRDHENQLLDNFMNAFIRAIWALALGWLILACVHGYGGPINWFLSLSAWKLPARLSYAMFMLHFPLQIVVNGSWTHTKYFTNQDTIYRFLSDVMMATLAAIALMLIVDAPFSTLQKLMMNGGGKRRPKREIPETKVAEADDDVHPTEITIGKSSIISNGITFRPSTEKTAL